MLTIIKNTDIYAPEHLGTQDILIANDKIVKIAENIDAHGLEAEIVDGANTICIPGIIDRHVHITGGGGEGGFSTSTPEVNMSTLLKNGITTVVGLLGTNDISRSVKSLLAKAKSLNEEGMTAYILTGGYGYPSATLTGDVRDDIMFISEILGLKLAFEDHRASHITKEELTRLASYVRVSSMLSRKTGFIHLHMGSGKHFYNMLYDIVGENGLPITLFNPTHVNRTVPLLEASAEFCRRGGSVDITSNIGISPKDSVLSAKKALLFLLQNGSSIDNITISSDGNGSMPLFDEDGRLSGMGVAGFEPTMDTLKALVLEENMDFAEALKPFTLNPAKALGIYPARGAVREGCFADMVLLDKELNIKDVYANGQAFVKEYEVIRKGTFE